VDSHDEVRVEAVGQKTPFPNDVHVAVFAHLASRRAGRQEGRRTYRQFRGQIIQKARGVFNRK
jgi:hypothetical protein